MPSIIMPKEDLVLASGSESRKIMLTEAGLDFSVKPSSVDESVIKDNRIARVSSTTRRQYQGGFEGHSCGGRYRRAAAWPSSTPQRA